jgi:hypothetical protein
MHPVPKRLTAALALLAAATLAIAPALEAATFRIHVARDPVTPIAIQSPRIWMQSDTVTGETACIEYNIGSTFVQVLGTFDTSGPAPANWRADIPAQPAGTLVRYQLFTRSPTGTDYGFTGFNWSYIVDAPVSAARSSFGRLKALYR